MLNTRNGLQVSQPWHVFRSSRMKHGRKALKVAAMLIGLAAHQQSNAAIWCAGTVSSVLVNQDGLLQADWGYTNVLLCSVSIDSTPPSPLTPISARTCQSVYSALLTAQATGKQFMALLTTESTCAGWAPNGTWSNKTIGTYRVSS